MLAANVPIVQDAPELGCDRRQSRLARGGRLCWSVLPNGVVLASQLRRERRACVCAAARSSVALVSLRNSASEGGSGSVPVGGRCNDAHLRLDYLTKARQVFDVLREVVAGVDRDERCGDEGAFLRHLQDGIHLVGRIGIQHATGLLFGDSAIFGAELRAAAANFGIAIPARLRALR